MNVMSIDLFILCIILLVGGLGLCIGAIRLTVPFSLVLVITTALYSSSQVSIIFKHRPGSRICLYLLIGFLSLLILAVVAHFTKKIIQATGFGSIDRLCGLVLGVIFGFLLVGALVWGINKLRVDWNWKDLLPASKLAANALHFFEWAMVCTRSLFLEPEIEKIPWWRRALW